MNKNFRFGAVGVALVASMGMGSAAHAASATATATAEVLQALTLNSDGTVLDFGTLVVPGAGTAVVNASNVRSCTGAVVCSGTTSTAGFNLTGTASKPVTVTLPTTPVVLSTAGGGTAATEITLDTFTASATSVTLDATGNGAFTVGGTIHMDGSEVAGIYSGTFTVTANYT